MSPSRAASRGACFESTDLGSGGSAGSVSGEAQTGEEGKVTVPSGRWGWARELIGSLGFDAERR